MILDKTSLKKFSEQKMMKDLEAVPDFPSTPSDLTLNEEVAPQIVAIPATEQQPQPVRKFVKTLRLTSDQLVCVSFFFFAYLHSEPTENSSRKRSTSNLEQM